MGRKCCNRETVQRINALLTRSSSVLKGLLALLLLIGLKQLVNRGKLEKVLGKVSGDLNDCPAVP